MFGVREFHFFFLISERTHSCHNSLTQLTHSTHSLSKYRHRDTERYATDGSERNTGSSDKTSIVVCDVETERYRTEMESEIHTF